MVHERWNKLSTFKKLQKQYAKIKTKRSFHVAAKTQENPNVEKQISRSANTTRTGVASYTEREELELKPGRMPNQTSLHRENFKSHTRLKIYFIGYIFTIPYNINFQRNYHWVKFQKKREFQLHNGDEQERGWMSGEPQNGDEVTTIFRQLNPWRGQKYFLTQNHRCRIWVHIF